MIAADSADAVAEWREHLHEIVSLHVNPADDIDWLAIKNRPEPTPPESEAANELAALARLEEFKPGFFDFLSGGTEKKQARLAHELEQAKNLDDAEFSRRQEEFQQELADWKTDKELADQLLAGSVAAERDVIGAMSSLSADGLVGSQVSFRISDEYLHAVAHVHDEDVVPNFRRKQLASGRLSETKMPVGERWELYQDYVCSVALRVAGDLFSILPREEVFVTCSARMLDSATGHKVDTPILSVQFVRPTFNSLRLSAIDPSDSMSNFLHNMDFRKTKGFNPTEALKPLPDEEG